MNQLPDEAPPSAGKRNGPDPHISIQARGARGRIFEAGHTTAPDHSTVAKKPLASEGASTHDVTDREWALVAPLLPAARLGGRPRTTCLRQVVNGIFYLLQAGCQWRMLPRDFPSRSTVYGYFRAWIAAGVWAHVHDVLYRRTREMEGRDESPTAAIIDSQSVKTSAEAREMVGYDAGKRIKGRKRHLVTDAHGLMPRIEVHSASVQDRDGAALVLDRITRRFPFLECIFADAGYQGPRVAAAVPRPVEIIGRTDAGFVVLSTIL